MYNMLYTGVTSSSSSYIYSNADKAIK